MPSTTISRRIDGLDLFAGCSRAELRQIDSLATYLHVPEGTVLIREGGFAKEFIVILRGSARVTRSTPDGTVAVADVGRGDFLGEIALLTGAPRSATVTATTDLEIMVSTVGEFRSIMEIAPSVARKVHLASHLRSTGGSVAA